MKAAAAEIRAMTFMPGHRNLRKKKLWELQKKPILMEEDGVWQ